MTPFKCHKISYQRQGLRFSILYLNIFFRNVVIDAIKYVCEYLQNQIISCISPLTLTAECCLTTELEDKYCLKRVTVWTLRSTIKPKHVGVCVELKGHVVGAGVFSLTRRKKNVLEKKQMKGDQEKSFKNGPNRINRIWIHVGWHHPVIPEKPLEGILFLTCTRWPLWFLELQL